MLFSNDLFMLDGMQMRLLQADTSTNKAWVIALHPHAWPECLPYSEIRDLERVSPPATPIHGHSQARIRRCEAAWKRLDPLLSAHGTSLFEPKTRKHAIAEHARKTGCAPGTLYKDLRRYWQRGQTKYALLPDYDKSGRTTPAAEGTSEVCAITAGRGRKAKNGYDTYQITMADSSFFRKVIEKEYLPNAQISVPAAYRSLVEQFYRYPDGNGELHVNPLGARPSLRQFRHFLLKAYDIETRLRGRQGNSDFEREHRKRLGTIMADCQGVGHYYEIDATIADIYLVSSEDVTKIIGKPTLYLIIDRKSRLIVGFYFGLENASWNGAMQAILSIAEDKRALCGRYGVPYAPEDWPAHQVFPSEFLADRGDMISHASSNVAEGLHVTVTNLPSKRPDWKPLVECGFRLIHNSIQPIAPAYDPPSNATRRRGKHYEKDACLTLRDFGHLILNTIIAYNQREMLGYDMDTKELLDNVRPSPIELWNHGIQSRAGLLTRYEESVVRFALLRKKKAIVTDKGIEFEGCFYSFPEAIAQKWFETARKRRFAVTVSYDTRLADSIYVHPLDGKREPYVATLTERSAKYKGMSFDEIAYYEYLRAVLRIDAEHSRLQNSIDLSTTTRPVMNAARERLKSAPKVSRSARRADIKEVREEERKLERKTLAKIEGGKRSDAPALHPEPQNSSPTTPTPTAASGSLAERIEAARARMRS